MIQGQVLSVEMMACGVRVCLCVKENVYVHTVVLCARTLVNMQTHLFLGKRSDACLVHLGDGG